MTNENIGENRRIEENVAYSNMHPLGVLNQHCWTYFPIWIFKEGFEKYQESTESDDALSFLNRNLDRPFIEKPKNGARN